LNQHLQLFRRCDGTVQRIEQVYGVGPEASTGAAEDGIMNLGGVAGASYEGIPGVGQGSGGSQSQNSAAASAQGSAGGQDQGSAGPAAAMDGLPEGRLAAGGDDAQAAVSVDGPSSNAAITSDRHSVMTHRQQ
jgi:hypothetical protein